MHACREGEEEAEERWGAASENVGGGTGEGTGRRSRRGRRNRTICRQMRSRRCKRKIWSSSSWRRRRRRSRKKK